MRDKPVAILFLTQSCASECTPKQEQQLSVAFCVFLLMSKCLQNVDMLAGHRVNNFMSKFFQSTYFNTVEALLATTLVSDHSESFPYKSML